MRSRNTRCGALLIGFLLTARGLNAFGDSEDTPFAFYGSDNETAVELGAQWTWAGPALRPCYTNWDEIPLYYIYRSNTTLRQVFEVLQTYPHPKDQPKLRQRIELGEFYTCMVYAVEQSVDVDHWAIGVEPDNDWLVWTPEELALYTRVGYKAVKDTDPTKRVLQGGSWGIRKSYTAPYIPASTSTVGRGYFVRVFDLLAAFEAIEHNPSLYDWSSNELALTSAEFDLLFAPDSYTHYFDIHHVSNFGDELDDYREYDRLFTDTVRAFLDSYGYTDAVIWDTQTGLHSGSTEYSTYTEADQAAFLLKKHLSAIAFGVPLTFWTTTHEWVWDGDPEHYFSKIGLIYDGYGTNDLGAGVPKLSAFTYKQMTDLLGGGNLSVTNVRDGTDRDWVYVFKVTHTGGTLHAAWWDYFDDTAHGAAGAVTVAISNLPGPAVAALSAVPFAEDGESVGDPKSAFRSTGYPVYGGVANIRLGRAPVYIEIDTDADALGDTWERVLGLHPLLEDTDGDGIDDGDELASGTDAYSASSFLAIMQLLLSEEQPAVIAATATDRVYRLWSSTNAGDAWTLVKTFGPVTHSPTTLIDSETGASDPNDAGRWYRVEAALPDLESRTR